MKKQFINGFTSWQETHFEIVQAITMEMAKDKPEGTAAYRHEEQGHGGLYELAEELTNEFEIINVGRQWDGQFYDEIEAFINDRL